MNGSNQPTWNANITARVPVLTDATVMFATSTLLDPNYPDSGNASGIFGPVDTKRIGQGGVVYNKYLDRYIYSTFARYTHTLYEAPTPWGPWTLSNERNFGLYPWNVEAVGGYTPTIPSKFIKLGRKDDVRVHQRLYHSHQQFGNVHLQFQPAQDSRIKPSFNTPTNVRGATNLADITVHKNATAIMYAARSGHPERLNNKIYCGQQSLRRRDQAMGLVGDHLANDPELQSGRVPRRPTPMR